MCVCVCACGSNPINWNSLWWWVKCLYRFMTRFDPFVSRWKIRMLQCVSLIMAGLVITVHTVRCSFFLFLFCRLFCCWCFECVIGTRSVSTGLFTHFVFYFHHFMIIVIDSKLLRVIFTHLISFATLHFIVRGKYVGPYEIFSTRYSSTNRIQADTHTHTSCQ